MISHDLTSNSTKLTETCLNLHCLLVFSHYLNCSLFRYCTYQYFALSAFKREKEIFQPNSLVAIFLNHAGVPGVIVLVCSIAKKDAYGTAKMCEIAGVLVL